jgi:putative aldouronate transport system permease protein
MNLKKGNRYKIWIYVFFCLLSLVFVLPILLVVSISFTEEASISAGSGFSLIPNEFSLDAYRLAFRNPQAILQAYWITSSQAVLGTVLSCLVVGMVAYPLSRTNFAYKGIVSFIIFFTMLFSGGMIPTYIIYTQWYGFADNYWVYILPGIAGGAWSTLVVRTFFKQLPESLFESAKIDGANELKCFFLIALPLSKPVFATIGFMALVGRWNEWLTSLLYIRDPDLFLLQFLLQRILREAEFMNNLMARPIPGLENIVISARPAETLRYAICVIAAGPMLVAFPFFQKYLSKGLTLGAIKG